MKFSRSSREHTSRNFGARSLSIFVIWPNYGTCAISCNSETASFLAHTRALANSPAPPRAHRLQFTHMTASNIRHFVQLGYLCDFARSQHGQYFRAPARVRKFPGPPGSASIGIFKRDRFSSSSFSLSRVLVRFRTIPRWSIF